MRHSSIRLAHAARGGPAVQAFAPGRVNLIGEHTDYNDGLCLPFAIDRGVTVAAKPLSDAVIEAYALDLSERDASSPEARSEPPGPSPAGAASCAGRSPSCGARGSSCGPADFEISGDVPRGAGLSSSAALSVSLCLALCAVAGGSPRRVELARLCSRIECEWCGADTGLLDQLASLCGERGRAVRIDMRGPAIESVAARARGPRPRHARLRRGAEHRRLGLQRAARASADAACRALGVDSLRDADGHEGLPEPLGRRVRHVLTENERVDAAAAPSPPETWPSWDGCSTPPTRACATTTRCRSHAVERAVEACEEAGRARRPDHGRRVRRVGARAVSPGGRAAGGSGRGRGRDRARRCPAPAETSDTTARVDRRLAYKNLRTGLIAGAIALVVFALVLGRGARLLMADEHDPRAPDAPPAGEAVHLPGPTYLPVVTALGLTIAVVGVVLSWILVVIGLVDHADRGGALDPRHAQDIATYRSSTAASSPTPESVGFRADRARLGPA